MLMYVALFIVIILSFALVTISIKLTNAVYEKNELLYELYKRSVIIGIMNNYIDDNVRNKVSDIYRLKSDPDKWICKYPGTYIRLLLEEDLEVSSKYDTTIKEYIKSHPEVENLPGTKRYINK